MLRRPHSGQALVVMLAFTACLLGAFLLVFNVGQVVNDKIKLTNAADAAAYSAAVWEARSLNFQAYLNRAMVANEVATAQLVSLRSWAQYVDTLTTNADRVARFVPPLAGPMRALSQGWGRINLGMQRALPPIEAALSVWNTEALSTAQSVAHQQALLAAADLVQHVAEANEPRAQVSAATRALQVRNGEVWQHNFTTRYQRGGRDLDRVTRLLADSRDGFTRSRRSDLPVSLPLISMPRRGGTDLLGEQSWRGVDTLSLHLDLLLNHVETPLGWGAAEQRRRVVTQRGEHGGSLDMNPRASRLALRQYRPSGSYRGVPEIRDVVNPNRAGARSLVYSVALQMPEHVIATADRLLAPAGLAGADGQLESVAPQYAGEGLHALGSAEVYFQRPADRQDGREEYPSLFNPYWQARLTSTSSAERSLTAPLRGLAVDPYAVLP
ncbi:MAG: pilus assembly protein TadG-related protein [Steroidobacteraceae bacterium]